MVFLTTRLWLRNRLTDRYWRVQEVLKHAGVSVRVGVPGAMGEVSRCHLDTLLFFFHPAF